MTQSRELSDAQIVSVLRLAALAVGRSEDPIPPLSAVKGDLDPLLSPGLVADIMYQAAPVGAGVRESEWPTLWPRCHRALEELARELEDRSGSGGFARRAIRVLERLIAARPQNVRDYRLGSVAVSSVECTAPIAELEVDAAIELVRFEVALENRRLGALELPACDGRVSAQVLSDAVAARFAWPILGRFFALAAYPQRGLSGDATVHDRVGWTTFLQELWGRPDLDEQTLYERGESAESEPIVSVDARTQIEVALELPAIEAKADPIAVDVSVGGALIGTMELRGGRTIRADELRASLTAFGGIELSRVAVREGLLGRPLAGATTLRDRLSAAAAEERDSAMHALPPGRRGIVLARRDPKCTGTSASRRASFPAAAADDLVETAAAVNEDVLDVSGSLGSPAVVYAPDILSKHSNGTAGLAKHGAEGRREAVLAVREAHDRLHFESLFAANEDPWDYGSEYERTKYAQTLELLPRRVRRAVEIGCAEGRFTVQLASRVGSLLALDVSEIALTRAAARCSEHSQVTFAQNDITRDPLPGVFDLVLCSEVLYYVERPALPAIAQKLASAVDPGGHLVTAHANVVRDQPDEPGFAWQHEFGAKVIGEALAATGSLELIREIKTAFYRVQLYRRPRRWSRARRAVVVEREAGPLPPRLVQDARLEGGEPPPIEERAASTGRLPILMYHRVTASGGNPRLARFRLSPEAFEQQLRYLRDTGHRTVDLDEWRSALDRKQPIPGRGVILTFDDGDAEFARVAWPLLQQYGFRPIVFLVAGLIGETNAWDVAFGDESPLLDWPAIERLRGEGVTFGSHSETHRALTGLSNADVVREATRSRRILETGLGERIDTFAYPYGDVDPAVEHLVGACGYTFGLTCREGRSRLVDSPLDLPRIEVSGIASFDAFVRSLDE